MFERSRRVLQERASDNEIGFTLIELLIVIVVLGILAGVTVFALGGVTSQSAVASCKADAKSVEVAVEAYRAQTGSYPAGLAVLVPTYLRTAPTSTHYAVTVVAATGEVDVQSLSPAIAAANFDGATNPCNAVT
jgi:general secretion pathway protein G